MMISYPRELHRKREACRGADSPIELTQKVPRARARESTLAPRMDTRQRIPERFRHALAGGYGLTPLRNRHFSELALEEGVFSRFASMGLEVRAHARRQGRIVRPQPFQLGARR